MNAFRSGFVTWTACMMALALGCGDSSDGSAGAGGTDTGGAGGIDSGGSGGAGAGSGGAGGTGGTGTATGGTGGAGGTGASAACDPTAEAEMLVDTDIDTDTTWACGTYVLEHKVHVLDGATLTIEPGVIVLGDALTAGDPPALIVTRGSRLVAEGTADEPIVFTSALSGDERSPGDFGGIVLLGEATINDGSCVDDGDTGTTDCDSPGYFEQAIEGIPPDDERGLYGGTDDASDCGSLEYVRVEFGGFKLGMDNELNGITVGGCGTGTSLSYLQVHRGSDDGMEFFGGTAGVDHVLLSGNLDDSLDWDEGWRGQVQYLIVHQFEGTGDKGFEGDNLGSNEVAEPTSKPEIWNATLIGTATTIAMHQKEGTLATLRNLIVTGFATVLNLSHATVAPGDIFMMADGWSIESSFLFDNDALGPDPAAETGMTDDDMGFNERMELADAIADAANDLADDVDPQIDLGFTVGGTASPDYVPGASATDLAGATPGAGFDNGNYAGAVEPGGTSWTEGWTSFPEGRLPM